MNKTFLDQHIDDINNFSKHELDKFSFKNLKKNNFFQINKEIQKKYSDKIQLMNLYPIICSETLKTCEIVNNNLAKNFYDYGHFTLDVSKYFGNKIIQNKFYKNFLDDDE